MGTEFKEGISLALPCRNCPSVSPGVVAEEKSTNVVCPRCGHTTTTKIDRRSDGWNIRMVLHHNKGRKRGPGQP